VQSARSGEIKVVRWKRKSAIAFSLLISSAFFSADAATPETKYLLFQVFTRGKVNDEKVYQAFPPFSEMTHTVQDIVSTIGNTGDKLHKLGFALGPISLGNSDEDVLRLIRDSFQLAKEKDIAVSLHIDDQMFWGGRKDLAADMNNLEWLDWNKTPNSGRRIEWGPEPVKIAPQLCLNSPGVRDAVKKRARLMGLAIREEVDKLKKMNKEHLFAGLIAGWESQIGRAFDGNKILGYCALSNKGFSAKNPPKDFDAELVNVVREFIELWAQELHSAGVEKNKIYSHIAFTPQGLFEPQKSLSYAQALGFGTAEVAFSKYYRPGFTTYPEEGTFLEIHKELAKRGTPPWISAEAANVVPNGLPGEPSMESFLGKIFNHGAVAVNIMAWGIGGEAEKNKNIFRLTTESTEAIEAYRKFLQGKKLTEKERPADAFSPAKLRQKLGIIQKEAPLWAKKQGASLRSAERWKN
jgi:hypothetical protein